jgi:pyruvate,water dikinase
VEAVTPLVVPLSDADGCREELVGGKAAKLARLARAGCDVPPGFCLTVAAYDLFVRSGGIETAIRMELGRKSLDRMRWEEIWDAALRIRSVFLSHALPGAVREALHEALASLGEVGPLAVRSSALGEDSAERSFAGLHESLTDVTTGPEVEKAVRLVWASLWSDAALLYRRELRLDPATSRMAVLVQRMIHTDRSGVAFGVDPRGGSKDLAIVEAVPGPCSLLVDGESDPDRWEIRRRTGEVVSWRPGEREEANRDAGSDPLLGRDDLDAILEAIHRVEELFRFPPDVEWTGRSDSLTILQARPITTAAPSADAERRRSLSLRPGDARLRELREQVAERLIPELEAEGRRMSEEPLDAYDDPRLADAIEQRAKALEHWKKIYWDVFIPFAHGVRRLATYYNDAVAPDDPYEFVGLLQSQPLLAAQRNAAIRELAAGLAENEALHEKLRCCVERAGERMTVAELREQLCEVEGGEDFARKFEQLGRDFLDITYDKIRMLDRPGPVLQNLLELARQDREPPAGPPPTTEQLEQKLLKAVGDERHDEVREMIALGRVSWKLRDDDNILVARVESQFLRALELGVGRLREAGRLVGHATALTEVLPAVVRALRDPEAARIEIDARKTPDPEKSVAASTDETPRQLIGQPASPGLASGEVRVVRGRDDLGKFRRGEVLVCDAIQPNMTHLAMLASAIVERRGGMLIHGAIIARELGIPCVNGIRDAAELLKSGDRVTVDGHLGILTVGAPELDLELETESVSSQP